MRVLVAATAYCLISLASVPAFSAGPVPPPLTLRTLSTLAPAPGEVAELGRIGQAAELCGLDAPARISRQTGLQVAALMAGAPDPATATAALDSFIKAAWSFREEYAEADDTQKSHLCAVAWLSWRAMREASPMSAKDPNISEAIKLVGNAGTLHWALWSCHEQGLLPPGPPPMRSIAAQTSLVLALAALNSSRFDEFQESLYTWHSNFFASRDAQAAQQRFTTPCDSVALSAKALGLAFERRGEILPALQRARVSRVNALGPKA